MLNRSAAITQAPEPGRLNGVLPVAPHGQVAMLSDYIDPGQTFVTCPNQDVVYGLGFFDLDAQPVIAQVPDFGDRFWVYALYDARTDQFAELGKPYASKPGFYLLAGPNWDGEVPASVNAVIRSSTSLANAIPRVFMDNTDEDRAAIQSGIDQIVFYPLSEFDGTMRTKDWSAAPSIRGPTSEGGGETSGSCPRSSSTSSGRCWTPCRRCRGRRRSMPSSAGSSTPRRRTRRSGRRSSRPRSRPKAR